MKNCLTLTVSLVLATLVESGLYAKDLSKSQTSILNGTSDATVFKKIKPELVYSNIDFNFNAEATGNYNSYQGYSNVFGVGADNMVLKQDVIAGVYYFYVNTSFHSSFILAPSSVTQSQQVNKNNTIFAHVLKTVSPKWYVDLAGGYGLNQLQVYSGIQTIQPFVANTNYDNWFVSLNALYRKTWDNFLLRTNIGAFYSQIDIGEYVSVPTGQVGAAQIVPSLVNKATLIVENVELAYAINNEMLPFVNAGLIQVAQFSNSRPLTTVVINGSLPQLSLDQSAFRLGTGISFKHKKLSARLEEKYYNSVGTFISYQTFLGLEYDLS